MAIEKVKAYFAQYGMADRVQEFPVSSATGELAAQALHCEPCHIAKTLSFLVGDKDILIVAAGDAKIDNPKYKAQFGTKAKMLTPGQVETRGGHGVGGVCPLPSTRAWLCTWMFPSSGSRRCSRPAAAATAPLN